MHIYIHVYYKSEKKLKKYIYAIFYIIYYIYIYLPKSRKKCMQQIHIEINTKEEKESQ